jgi:hypothetical protein
MKAVRKREMILEYLILTKSLHRKADSPLEEPVRV